jgi:hypothetical protein
MVIRRYRCGGPCDETGEREETGMAFTATEDDLRQAALEAREAVLRIVATEPGVHVNDLYRRLTGGEHHWPEPSVRTAIWDLIAERRVVIRLGNEMYPPSD